MQMKINHRNRHSVTLDYMFSQSKKHLHNGQQPQKC
ncbi:hypothetical protein AGR5A_pa40047 [Agrobacterium genomosp. 5 str. CFBP 6626]|nr:hypothetical protein AGR5A_pa40047 [Agrobacterium genomosp. 5 str. CFBP 6626]